MKSSLFRNTVFNVVYKILNVLFPIVSVSYVSRILGPEYIGKVTYAQNILSYFMIIATLGIPTYGIREIAKVSMNYSVRSIRFSELFIINLVSTLISSIIFSLYICIFQFNDFKLFLAVGITLYINMFNFDWFYAGIEEYVYISIRSFIIKLLSIIMLLVFVKGKNDFIIYAIITSFATSGNYLLNLIKIKTKVRFVFVGIQIKKHLKPIAIMFVTILATDLYNQIDITMIGYWYSSQNIGYYSNAVKLIRVLYAITSAIGATAIPRMTYFYSIQNNTKFVNMFNSVLKILILIAIPMSIGVFMLRERIVTALFGLEFLPSASIIAILSSLIIIISISYFTGTVVLTSTNNEKYLMKATITGAVVNICMNLLLIPAYGICGAAIASVIAESAVLLVHYYYSKKYYKILINLKFVISILIANILMIATLHLISKMAVSNILVLVLSVICGALIYLLALLFFKNELLIELKNTLINGRRT